MANILDNVSIATMADGTQQISISAGTSFNSGVNVNVSKSADGQTLIVKVTYKVNLKLFKLTRTSTMQYNPSTGSLKVIA
jgi:hypothetical protein